jgi:hypothetical protein
VVVLVGKMVVSDVTTTTTTTMGGLISFWVTLRCLGEVLLTCGDAYCSLITLHAYLVMLYLS